jgi:hypothetical protein
MRLVLPSACARWREPAPCKKKSGPVADIFKGAAIPLITASGEDLNSAL